MVKTNGFSVVLFVDYVCNKNNHKPVIFVKQTDMYCKSFCMCVFFLCACLRLTRLQSIEIGKWLYWILAESKSYTDGNEACKKILDSKLPIVKTQYEVEQFTAWLLSESKVDSNSKSTV